MVEIIREFIVKEEARGRFELMYGPGGAWGRLFAPCAGYRGSALLRDVRDARRYLAVDFWDAESQYEQALAERRVEYAELEAALGGWTESRAKVGAFRVLAEATVRSPAGPRGRRIAR